MYKGSDWRAVSDGKALERCVQKQSREVWLGQAERSLHNERREVWLGHSMGASLRLGDCRYPAR
jgi:hypothetical protein